MSLNNSMMMLKEKRKRSKLLITKPTPSKSISSEKFIPLEKANTRSLLINFPLVSETVNALPCSVSTELVKLPPSRSCLVITPKPLVELISMVMKSQRTSKKPKETSATALNSMLFWTSSLLKNTCTSTLPLKVFPRLSEAEWLRSISWK